MLCGDSIRKGADLEEEELRIRRPLREIGKINFRLLLLLLLLLCCAKVIAGYLDPRRKTSSSADFVFPFSFSDASNCAHLWALAFKDLFEVLLVTMILDLSQSSWFYFFGKRF